MAWFVMLNYSTNTVDYMEVEDGDYDEYLTNETLMANHIDPDSVAVMACDDKPFVYNVLTDKIEKVFEDE